MKNNIIYILLCIMPTLALAYNDKYDGGGSGLDFILYVAFLGGIVVINLIRSIFNRGKK